jgi:hypothetical protein
MQGVTVEGGFVLHLTSLVASLRNAKIPQFHEQKVAAGCPRPFIRPLLATWVDFLGMPSCSYLQVTVVPAIMSCLTAGIAALLSDEQVCLQLHPVADCRQLLDLLEALPGLHVPSWRRVRLQFCIL